MSAENDWSELQRFSDWLDQTPPYEAVGRVIIEGARLSLGLLEFCVKQGASRAEVSKWGAAQSMRFLRKNGIDSDWLTRCERALENRNALAHGVWFNAFGRGEAFIKHTRGSESLSGPVVNDSILREWSDALSGLADEVEAMAR